MSANVGSVVVDDRAGTTRTASNSYGTILESSALIGAATLANVLVGIVRAKALAILLGPAGYGLVGTFQAVADLTRSVAEIGVNSSGVRQIAQSAASEDASRIAVTATVLRRVAVVLGLLGAALLLAFAAPIASFTFGTGELAAATALLALAVFLRMVSDGQAALLQGLRRIGDLARATVAAALLGTAATIFLVWRYRADGVVPALIAMSAASLACTWWFVRKARVRSVRLPLSRMRGEVRALLRLGLAFMGSGLLMAGAAYAGRIIVLDRAGLDGVGLYHAAWSLGSLYVGFVLQAMGADFYPRLVGAVDDRAQCRRLVNEQAHASMLLAIPGVLATLAFAPLVLSLFYSREFAAAAETLRWLCVGMALRVVTWPMGYIIVAKGAQTVFFLAELAWASFNVASTWALVNWLGLPGIGIAFFASYLFHYVLIYPIVRRMVGFRWSPRSAVTATWVLGACFATLALTYVLPESAVFAVGLLVTLASAAYAARVLVCLLPADRLPPRLRRLLPNKGGAR